MTVGLVSRRGRRGRPPKLTVTAETAEQQAERRRDRLQALVEQCEDEELMDVVLPRLTKMLSLWELLLAKVERGGPTRTRFPDIYREFESLQAQVRQAAQDYIISPQAGAAPLEVRNIEVARSLGILDEVNRMKVVPGATPCSSLTNKNVRYMENSKMLPPSKRFKMENSIPVQQNGIETPRTGDAPVTSSLKPCLVSVSPLVVQAGSKLLTTTDSVSSLSGSTSPKTPVTKAPSPTTLMEETPGEDQGEELLQSIGQDQVLSTGDITDQMKEVEEALDSSSETAADSSTPQIPETSSGQNPTSSTDICEPKEVQEGQEIYIQTDGLTVQLAEPGLDRIVIVNGPDGTTMHIQTPEGVPLEAVQALLGIEASDGAKAPQ